MSLTDVEKKVLSGYFRLAHRNAKDAGEVDRAEFNGCMAVALEKGQRLDADQLILLKDIVDSITETAVRVFEGVDSKDVTAKLRVGAVKMMYEAIKKKVDHESEQLQQR